LARKRAFILASLFIGIAPCIVSIKKGSHYAYRWVARGQFQQRKTLIARTFASRHSARMHSQKEIRLSKRIYVGSLPYSATEDQLEELFGRYGQVNEVSIITDRYTGQAKGFAFVEMTNDNEALKAIDELNGSDMGGRTLVVNEARAREERSGGGGGGGFRSGGGGGGGGGGPRGGGGGGGRGGGGGGGGGRRW
jgi:cold-inducible RNA-binding protein